MTDHQAHDTEIRRYLPHALLATAWVVAVPMVLVSTYVSLIEPPPSRLLSATLGVLLSIAATVAGTAVWMRRPGSGVVSFGDLMIWGWIRRYRAEKSLHDGSRVLGFDRKGRPVGQVNLTVEEQLKVLHQLNDALETKDPYTHGHSRRVEKHCYRMGMHLELAEKELEDLRLAAALHDVGKVAVPDDILRKPGRLEPPEKEIMNQHPVVGERMVQDIRNERIITAIRHHHEEYKGGGYPDGIAGDSIPLFSRIIAVADTYDAMTSTRPYRTGMPRKKAVSIITEEKGKQFDPKVVDAFLADHSVQMPIPVGLAQILEAPREFLMRMLVWGKQVGSASLASATAAAGVAVATVAGVVAPSMPAPGGSASVLAAPYGGAREFSELADDVLGIRVEREPKKKKEEAPPPEDDTTDLVQGAVIAPPTDEGDDQGGRNQPSDNGNRPPGNNNPPGNNPPTPPPPVEPPVVLPPTEPPPVAPPGPPAGGNTGGGGGSNPGGGGGGGGGTPPPPAPVDTFPPGPPPTRPPHTPGTDPQPDHGNDSEQRDSQPLPHVPGTDPNPDKGQDDDQRDANHP
ncbi:MAG: HD-GYP domain-containing protein [Actinomycetota bacterium]